MSGTKSKTPKLSSDAKPPKLASGSFLPIAITNLPLPKEQFSSEGFVPRKEPKE